MKPPEDIKDNAPWAIPSGYINVATLDDKYRRHAIPGPDHPYWSTRNLITRVLQDEMVGHVKAEAERLADKIMEAM